MNHASRTAPGDLAEVHVLHPGDVACASRGARLETLLGSCVAIILTDPRRTVGAMCHIVHSGRALAGVPESTAYAHTALARMFFLLRARGITPALCEAYVYGGGNMFPDQVRSNKHIGALNSKWALEALDLEGVNVLHHDVGGRTYRRLSWTVGHDAPQVTAVEV